MKLGRALFHTVVTSCVWAFRMIIPWASSTPSVANVIAAFAFAGLTKMKRAYNREAGKPNQLPSPDERKLSAVAVWEEGKVEPVDVAQGTDPGRTEACGGHGCWRQPIQPEGSSGIGSAPA
jgi:hypothetical protein